VSGEESLEQIKLRGDRLGVGDGELYLLAETSLERILAQADKVKPKVLVVDSVQTVFRPSCHPARERSVRSGRSPTRSSGSPKETRCLRS